MFKPIGHRIIVKPEEIKKKTESGLLIEYGSNELLEKGARIRGSVVAIGPTAWREFNLRSGVEHFNWVEIGDTVYYAKYAGKSIKDPDTGEEFVVLNDEDVVVSWQ